MKKIKLTKKQNEILFECWENGNNTKDWLGLIAEKLPDIQPLRALPIMRKMMKVDEKWKKAVSERKRIIEENKLKIKLEKERISLERIKKKQHYDKVKYIRNNLTAKDIKTVESKIETDFFFCSDMEHYVSNISCIFKMFSNDYLDLSNTKCDKCQRMNKFIPILEEIINDKSKRG